MAEALLNKEKKQQYFEREYYSKYKSRNIFQRTLFNFNLIDIEEGGLDPTFYIPPPPASFIYKYWYYEVSVESNLFAKV